MVYYPTMSEPLISVIIPTYNRAKMLCDCIASVLATEYPHLEIVVADDCSTDGTRDEIVRRFADDPRVKYCCNETNSQAAITRNNGARHATGDYLFFLDDDNLVDRNIFVELMACFGRHPEAGLVAPLIIHRSAAQDPIVWTIGSDFHRWNCRTNDAENGGWPLSKTLSLPEDLPTTYSPNAFMVTREAHAKTGGFDETMLMTYEESDYGWRLMKMGYSEFITRKAITTHCGYMAPGLVPALRAVGMERANRTYCFARNRAIFARRHFNFIQSCSVTFLWMPIFAVYYCRLALVNRRPDIAWAFFKGTLAGMFGLYSRRKPDYA